MLGEEFEKRLTKLEKALTEIDTARAHLVEEIHTLRLRAVTPAHALQASTVTRNSKTSDKLALFRSLFGGRTDVYAQRWDNPKMGKSGYSPACHNEWTKEICDELRTSVIPSLIQIRTLLQNLVQLCAHGDGQACPLFSL
jgi:hypothetical protein